MSTDYQIASEIVAQPIEKIAEKMGLPLKHVMPWGRNIAKISLDARNGKEPEAKTVLVTAMTPTPAGEGKTTVSIGLSEALNRIGRKTIVTLREPSLGPVFGVKGGAAGGGYSQVIPMDSINLHFTGDIHAVTSAHNLLAALLDNYYSRVEKRCLLPKEITWNRVLDMNDRSLRNIVIGLGKDAGMVRESKFDITASSEIMAILGLSRDMTDLKERLGRIIIAETHDGVPFRARDLNAEGALAILLKDAIMPNLVQTLEGNPALIHTGPFANIAHGTNSIVATDIAKRYAEMIVIEAGFGSDLGAEKFFDLVSRTEGMTPPDVVVIVATVRALKYHGGAKLKSLTIPDVSALEKGFENLKGHIENMISFNRPVFVALNRFSSDTAEEINIVRKLCENTGTRCFDAEVWAKGGAGAIELAEAVYAASQEDHGEVNFIYDLKDDPIVKIRKIAERIYGAKEVHIPRAVESKIDVRRSWGISEVPVCMAKTQYSFSDNPDIKGRPTGFKLEIKDIKYSAGAGFMVVYTGDIMTMPGLPAKPASSMMDIDQDGIITGLF
ncbi:MAG TPA: formate--tetrahydrofolate ligase [bacterium]|nr:formate--tetrahydrofolate ligase [bacterium]